jgi:PIN domain nuclease of toxin-antitoxin system
MSFGCRQFRYGKRFCSMRNAGSGIDGDLATWVSETTNRFRETPLTHEIVLAADSLQLQSDPADRFLAATAKVLGLTLVTADRRLLALGDIATLANR